MQSAAEVRRATIDGGQVYETTRATFITLVRSLSDAQLQRLVPASPKWRVRDVFAHVVGITADLNAGDLRDIDPDTWTAAQVALRYDRPIEAVIAEWDLEAPIFADGLRLFGYSVGSHFVGDLLVHLQDVRQALGLAPNGDELTVRVALDFYLEAWSECLTEDSTGSITITADGERSSVGSGDAFATLTAAPFEILRACSGRRSAEQIAAFTWTGDARRAMATISRYSLPAHDLID